MAARITLKVVTDGCGYFYFWTEDTADWVDRTVRVEKISALTLDQWVAEYLRLKKVNAELMGNVKAQGSRHRQR